MGLYFKFCEASLQLHLILVLVLVKGDQCVREGRHLHQGDDVVEGLQQHAVVGAAEDNAHLVNVAVIVNILL